jgi:tetratricopeptide (TPR) repeat protein
VRRRYLLAGIALVVLGSACSGGTARRTDPAAADAALGKALNDLRAGHTSLATREFRAVVKLDPNNKFAWFDLGVGEGKAGHVSEADRDYLRAIAIDPGFEPALFNYGYDQYGSKHYAPGSTFLIGRSRSDGSTTVAASPRSGSPPLLSSFCFRHWWRRSSASPMGASSEQAPSPPAECSHIFQRYPSRSVSATW